MIYTYNVKFKGTSSKFVKIIHSLGEVDRYTNPNAIFYVQEKYYLGVIKKLQIISQSDIIRFIRRISLWSLSQMWSYKHKAYSSIIYHYDDWCWNVRNVTAIIIILTTILYPLRAHPPHQCNGGGVIVVFANKSYGSKRVFDSHRIR